MAEITVQGSVSSVKKPKMGQSFIWLLGVIICTIVIVTGMMQGKLYLLVVLLPLGLFFEASRRARSRVTVKNTAISLFSDDIELRIQMPRTKLYEGRYIDQLYRTRKSDIEQITIDHKLKIAIRSRLVDSIAFEDATRVMQKNIEFAEVSFKTDKDSKNKLCEFFAQSGLAVQDSSGL